MKALGTIVIGAVAASFFGSAAMADARDILVRGRLIGVLPNEGASLTLDGAATPGSVSIEDQYVPEVDFTYFVTDNVAVELIAAVTPHDVDAVGTALSTSPVSLGDVTLLPPTLTLQYHFDVNDRVKPYVGVGVNYTTFFDVNEPAGMKINYDDSFGLAAQAGVDIDINDRWFWNLDVKYIDISPDVTVDIAGVGVIGADVDIDPVVVGIGFGYRFSR